MSWYYEEISDACCPSCGELLWGPDWWDGWAGDPTSVEVECEACGASWSAGLEYQEPRVIALAKEAADV
jgi:hypothetical protein